MRSYVLDASAFIKGAVPDRGRLYTVPEVVDELRDPLSRARFEAAPVHVREPAGWAVRRARRRARLTGDADRLSITDLKVLALAVELRSEGRDVTIISSDYALQNVARSLKLDVYGPVHGEIREVRGPTR